MKRLVVIVLMLAMAGCKEDSGTVPVNGLLQLDGQPLKEASIQFVPQGTGRDATGTTDANGKFVMSTFEPKDGVMPGSYKVVITPAAPADAPAGGDGSADAAMTAAAAAAAAKPKNKTAGHPVPEAYTRLDQTPLKQDVPPSGEVVFDIKSK